MNINNPKRRFGSSKRRPSNSNPIIPTVVPPSLSNAVPKHNLGATNRNPLNFNQTDNHVLFPINEQGNFDTYKNDLFPFSDQDNIYDDPFDILNIGPFDELYSENTPEPAEKNMDDLNKLPVIPSPVKKPSANKYSTPTVYHQSKEHGEKVARKTSSHILTPLFLKWIEIVKIETPSNFTHSQSQITSLIRFLIDHEIDQPTTKDIILYLKQITMRSDLSMGTKKDYKSAINNFFSWTELTGKYNDISTNIHLYEYINPITQKQDVMALDAGESSSSVVYTNEISTFFNDAINKRLLSLDNQFPDDEYKNEMVTFVSFLIRRNILRPASGTIVNYCRKLRRSNPRSFQILQDFFTWTQANDIYENITSGIELLCTVPLAKRSKKTNSKT